MIAAMRQDKKKGRFIIVAQAPEVDTRPRSQGQRSHKVWKPVLVRVWVGATILFLDETRLMKRLVAAYHTYFACLSTRTEMALLTGIFKNWLQSGFDSGKSERKMAFLSTFHQWRPAQHRAGEAYEELRCGVDLPC